MDALAPPLYYTLFVLLSVHGLHRLVQVLCVWLLPARREAAVSATDTPRPFVTVQLPIYDERWVAARLLEACAALRWPRDRFEIQVLDDSQDDTVEIVATKVRELRARGVAIAHVRRQGRRGFKAGALAFGLAGGEGQAPARGEWIAIFDADFVPPPDFLDRCAPPLLTDPRVGLVQARWGHLNRSHSLLTRVQALLLDAHFAVEHEARVRAGHFVNFNGTAGLWRRSAIEAAGGWSHDTLTEDLDLSIRAQLAGWRFVYLHDVVAPAELPAEMNAFKSQQHRWAKGGIQCARKLLPRVWNTPGLRETTRLEALFHLGNHLTYPVVALLSVLALPVAWLASTGRMQWPLWFGAYALGAGLVPVLLHLVLGQLRVGRSLGRSLLLLVPAMALGIGIAMNQTFAILEALRDQRSDFVRTPKFELRDRAGTWLGKGYLARRSVLAWLELGLGLACITAFVLALQSGAATLAVFLGLFAVGHAWVALASLLPEVLEHVRARSRARRETPAPSPAPVAPRAPGSS